MPARRAFLARYDGARRLPGDTALRAAAADSIPRQRPAGRTPRRRRGVAVHQRCAPLAEVDFTGCRAARIDGAALFARLPAIDAPRLVFADGRFARTCPTLPARLQPLRRRSRISVTLAWPDREPMVALNTMLAEDGADI